MARSSRPPGTDGATTTVRLLALARAGDRQALDRLFERYGPELRRLAHGRREARQRLDTPDLVQDTLLQTFLHLDQFDDRGDGALRAYMRQVLVNRIRDEYRRAARRQLPAPLPSDARAPGPSPLESAIGAEALGRYDDALAALAAADRELVIARVELGLSFPEIAVATGRPSANAARMAVVRALVRLSEALADGTDSTPE